MDTNSQIIQLSDLNVAEHIFPLLVIVFSSFFGAFFGAWLQTKYSRRKKFEEIMGGNEVEACQKAFTIVFNLRGDWQQSDEKETARKYVDEYYKWVVQNRAFIPSELYNVFGTLNREMCHILIDGPTTDQNLAESKKISKLLEKADKILCKIFNKKPFTSV